MNESEEQSLEDLTWVIESHIESMRLDAYLSQRFAQWSRAVVKAWIGQGAIQLNGKIPKASATVVAGMSISCTDWPVTEGPNQAVIPQNIPLHVIYEDDRVVVIDKPAGLTVHPGAGCPDGTLANALAWRYPTLSTSNGVSRPGIVHRLDRDTSGLLVVARDDEAHRCLAAQLADRTLSRVYHALTWGIPNNERIDLPIGRDPHLRTRMAVVNDGRVAATRVQVLRPALPASLVECRLETGRTHQIRVHLSHLGHAIVGDPVYGGDRARLERTPPVDRPQARQILQQIQRQSLHAREISFIHPNGQKLSFESPWPEDFARAVQAAFPTA